jgi:hypothetical protein
MAVLECPKWSLWVHGKNGWALLAVDDNAHALLVRIKGLSMFSWQRFKVTQGDKPPTA